jgi:hypothetical protein
MGKEDVIRVLRVIEYVGPRADVTAQLSRSLPDGTKQGVAGVSIRVGTVGSVLGFETLPAGEREET